MGSSHPAKVDLRLDPENVTVQTNTIFDMRINVEPNGQDTTGVQAFVDFDQSLVQVLALRFDPDSPLSIPLLKSFDNNQGTIDLVAGTLGAAATDSFILGTITFTTRGATGETSIVFSTAKPRRTIAGSSGQENQRSLFGADLAIQGLGATPTPTNTPMSTPTPSATPSPTPTPTPTPGPPPPTPTPGSTPTAVPHPPSVVVRLVAEPAQVEPGATGEIGVYVDPIQLQTTGVQVFADFDTTRLEILSVDMEQQSPFERTLSREFDNTVGTLNVSAGTLGQSVGSSFKLATIRYRAKQTSGQTEFSVSTVSPRDTVASIMGLPLSTLTLGAVVSIQRTPIVDIRIQPESINVRPDQIFQLDLVVEPNGQAVTGVQVFLNFDPQAVEVLSVVPDASSTLDLALINVVDNVSGTVDFAVGSLTSSADTNFVLARLTLRARTSGELTEITFATEHIRSTTVSMGGEALQRGLFGSSINVQSLLNISVEKSVRPVLPEVGETVTYTIKVQNNGPGLAESVTVVDPLPEVVEFVSVVSTQGTCGESEAVVTCELGDIPEGKLIVVTIVTVNVLDILQSDDLRNIVTVFSGPNNFPEAQAAVDLPSTTPLGLLVMMAGLSAAFYYLRRRRTRYQSSSNRT